MLPVESVFLIRNEFIVAVAELVTWDKDPVCSPVYFERLDAKVGVAGVDWDTDVAYPNQIN